MKNHESGEMLGHPKGLFLLFGTEMWERMSYFGMRGIFVLYLTQAATAAAMGWSHLSFEQLQSNALSILGTYAMLVYLTPVIGGWLADNKLGQRKAILIGCLLMMTGQFILGTPHWMIPGLERLFLWCGLTLLIVGNGFFKPNISTMVGDLYTPGDQRRDSAFTIFYMGINLGSILGYFVVGSIGEKINYQYGFLAAGMGMGIGLMLQLFMARRYLGDIGNKPAAQLALAKEGKHKPLSQQERDRIKVVLVLGLFTVMFWTGFEQAAGSMNLFAKYNTDLVFWGWEMPASWLQSVNPLLVVALAPLFASLWVRMDDREPNSPVKFAWGLLMLGVGFLAMVGAALQIDGNPSAKASVVWLILAYFFHTVGELCLSPVGMSMVTKLSPLRYTSLMMGLWYFFTGLANKAAGEVGRLVGEAGPLATFGGVAVSSIICGLVLFLLSDKLVDWMHGAEGKQARGTAIDKSPLSAPYAEIAQ
ncbi:peptide MFS transporter [Pseudomaricurvus alkylphenolicus]|nr:peptide MFS transporter [Pseudomaricurvus alkylphenolicus]